MTPDPNPCMASTHCFDCGPVIIESAAITVIKGRREARYRFPCPKCGALVERIAGIGELIDLLASDATFVDHTDYGGAKPITEAEVRQFASAVEHVDRLAPFATHSRSLFPGVVRRLRRH